MNTYLFSAKDLLQNPGNGCKHYLQDKAYKRQNNHGRQDYEKETNEKCYHIITCYKVLHLMKFSHRKDMTALSPGLNIRCRKNLTLPDYAEDKNQPSHRTHRPSSLIRSLARLIKLEFRYREDFMLTALAVLCFHEFFEGIVF